MSKNPYFNTMWTKRDRAFYNNGLDDGFIIGMVGMGIICGWTAIIVDKIKTKKESEKSRP